MKFSKQTTSFAVGMSAVATFAGIALATAPAQATQLGYTDLTWGGRLNNIGNTFINSIGNATVAVDFTTLDFIDANGALAGATYSPSLPPLTLPPVTLNLDTPTLVSSIGGIDIYDYLSNGLTTFNFGTVTPTPSTTPASANLSYVIPDNTGFRLVHNTNIAGEGRLLLTDTRNPYLVFDGQIQNPPRASAITFNAVGGNRTGSYGISYNQRSVPEPGTFLGLFALGGLALTVKRKKLNQTVTSIS